MLRSVITIPDLCKDCWDKTILELELWFNFIKWSISEPALDHVEKELKNRKCRRCEIEL